MHACGEDGAIPWPTLTWRRTASMTLLGFRGSMLSPHSPHIADPMSESQQSQDDYVRRMREVVQPTETPVEGAMKGWRLTHPAYAVISVNRVQGHLALFQSDLRHHGFMVLRIGPAEVDRHLSRDWGHGDAGRYIEVAMSEAQWASFISSANSGPGSPCTLRSLNREPVPQIPDPAPPEDKFRREIDKGGEEALLALAELDEAIDALGLSARKSADLKGRVTRARRTLEDSIPFVAKQFSEHVEDTVEAARAEIHAHAQTTLTRLGLDALGVKSPVDALPSAAASTPPDAADAG